MLKSCQYFPVSLMRLFIAFVFLTLMSCAKEHKLTEDELFFLSSLKGQSGIIAEPSFVFSPIPPELTQAWNAVGVVSLSPHNDFKGTTGTGIFVRRENDDGLYILTAKHILYDVKSLKLKTRHGYFIVDLATVKQDYKNGNLLELQLGQMPRSIEQFDKNADFILVPITQKHVAHFIYKESHLPISFIEKVESLNPERLYSIGAVIRDDVAGNSRFHKFYQTDFFVKQNTVTKALKSDNPRLVTNLDAIPGLSGSPVFYKDDQQGIKLIGLIVSRTKKTGCNEFQETICSNKVLLMNE